MSQPSTTTAKTLPRAATASTPWVLTLFALGTFVVALLLAYSTTVSATYRVWMNSETHQFALLVLPMSLFLIWERRTSLRAMTPSPSASAVLLTLPLGLLWVVAEAVDVAQGAQLAVLGMLQVALLSLLGWQVYRALLFPLLFLWLLVPFGDSLTPYLMDLATWVTAGGLALFGLNVTTDGNILISEAGRVGIVAECSALDFLIGNLVLSLFYANLVYTGTGKRIAYVAVGLLAAIVANNVRTTSVILITYWSDGAWDLLADHRLFGWVVFLVFVVAQMSIGARFKDPQPRARPAPSAPRIGASYGPQRAYIYLVALALIASMVLPPTLLSARSSATRGAAVGTLETPAWLQPAARTQDAWHPVFVGAQTEFLASHPVNDRIVDLYLAYYWHQDADAELVGWPNAVYDAELWHPLEQQSRSAMLEGRALSVTETRLRGPQRARRLTWHWYWVDGTFTASPLVAKLLQAKATLLGGDTRSAVVVVSTPEQSDPETARQAMQHFVAQATFLRTLLASAGQSSRESAGVAAAR